MKALIRLGVLIVIASGVALVVVNHRGDARSQDGQPSPSVHMPSPSQSQVALSEDADGTLISYDLIAGDALVIRFSDDDMTGCTLKIHTGPHAGSEHAESGITVDDQIVPADQWQAAVRDLGQGCGQYWYSID